MNKLIYLLLLIFFISCNSQNSQNNKRMDQKDLNNNVVKAYSFLDCMYSDTYFPKFLVDKCKSILLNLCLEIETEKPSNLKELYKLSHSATNKINNLEDEFYENNSEIETMARECLGRDFDFIANAYNFKADIEELIATRNW